MFDFKKRWQNLSNLGIKPSETELNRQSSILTNQITVITALTMVILLIIIRTDGILKHEPMSHGTARLLSMLLVLIFCMGLNRTGKHHISRSLLIFISPMILLILPVLLGYVEEENFFYYPYVLIALSVLPQLVLIPNKNKLLYIVSLAYYFLLIFFNDLILVTSANEPFESPKIYADFYLVYKVFPLVIFLFTAISIYYLRKLNTQYEEALQQKNISLDHQNEELATALDQLQKAQDKLVHQQKMAALGHLTAGVSHEINNPLNYIAGGAFLIEDEIQRLESSKIKNENLRQAAEMITDGIKRVSYIINLLDAFSNNKQHEKTSTDLNKLIESTLCFITAKANRQISIVKEFGTLSPVYVVPDELQRVILSIFDNAVDAIFEKPKLSDREFIKVTTFESEVEGKLMAVAEIENSGPQISAEHLPHIFEPFYTTKPAGKGSGLNLSNSYSILSSYGGFITVKNCTSGVVFSLYLPIVE